MVARSKEAGAKEIHSVPRQVFVAERGDGMVQEAGAEKGERRMMSDFAKDKNVPINDCISRQAAIDALIAEGRNVDSRYLESERIIHESDVVEVISLLPSAQPEPKWIPVTEHLPKLGEKVLVSTKNTIFTQVFKRIYGTPDNWGWEHHTIKKVTAWMPLPKRYEGRDE